MSLIILIFVSFILINQGLLLMVGWFGLVLYKKKKILMLWILVIVLFYCRLSFIKIKPNFKSLFNVINVSNHRIKVSQHGFYYVINCKDCQLSRGDIVQVEGRFINEESATKRLNHQLGKIVHSKVRKVGEAHKIKWIDHQISKSPSYPLLAKIFFQDYYETDSDLLKMMISTGMILSSLFSFCQKLIKISVHYRYHKIVNILCFAIIFYFFGMSFTMIRLFISLMMKSLTSLPRNHRNLIEMCFILFIYPFAIHTFVFWLIFVIKLDTFLLSKEGRPFKRLILIAGLQLFFNYEVNVVNCLFFSFYRFTSSLIGLNTLFSVIFQKEVMFQLTQIVLWLEHHAPQMIVRGQLNWILGGCLFYSLIKRQRLHQHILQIALLLCCFWLSIYGHGYYKIVYLDVKQGDATLLISPYHHEVFLIDTGQAANYYLLKKSLNQYGIYHLNGLIITHDDHDHNGCVDLLQKDYTVNQLFLEKNNSLKSQDFDFEFYLKNFYSKDSNENSLLFKVTCLNQTFLFTGDAPRFVERKLLQENPELKVKFLKAGHHGSKTSSDPYFVAMINPKYLMISSDPSVYGHPHYEVKKLIIDYQLESFQTSQHHNIEVVIFRHFNLVIFNHGIQIERH